MNGPQPFDVRGPDRIVWRDQLQGAMRISGETVRRWIRDCKLPKPDIYPTRQCMGWKLSTLRRAGFDIAGEEG